MQDDGMARKLTEKTTREALFKMGRNFSTQKSDVVGHSPPRKFSSLLGGSSLDMSRKATDKSPGVSFRVEKVAKATNMSPGSHSGEEDTEEIAAKAKALKLKRLAAFARRQKVSIVHETPLAANEAEKTAAI